MRKLTALLLLILSFSLIAPVANSANIKVGDSCKKINQKVTASGQDLICKKQGKKRIWVVAKKQPVTSGTSASPKPSATEEATTKGYTKAEVASRNTTSNCWTIIANKVYDLTEWVSKHPGGSSAIASICGIDGTLRFKSQHGSSGRANGTLDGYYIGDLK